eukprot:scaffold36156_cov66-Phaeocystis_antarctica.AAC.2
MACGATVRGTYAVRPRGAGTRTASYCVWGPRASCPAPRPVGTARGSPVRAACSTEAPGRTCQHRQ